MERAWKPCAGRRERVALHRLFVRRRFLGHPRLDQSAIGVAEPDAVGLEPGWRVELPDVVPLEARAQPLQVLGVAAEGQVGEPLGRPLSDAAPAVVVAGGVEAEAGALLAHVQAEARVEPLGVLEVGHGEVEVVHGMQAKLAGAARVRRQAADLGRRRPPVRGLVPCGCWSGAVGPALLPRSRGASAGPLALFHFVTRASNGATDILGSEAGRRTPRRGLRSMIPGHGRTTHPMPQRELDGAAEMQPCVVDVPGFVESHPAGRFQVSVLPLCAAVLFMHRVAWAAA